LENAVSEGAPTATVRFENRCLCKDGSYKWLDWVAVPVPELGSFYAAARDVTEQKRAETELAEALERERGAREDAEDQKSLLRLLIEQSGDAVIMTDEAGVLRVFNPEAEKLHGVTKQEVQALEWAKTYGLYGVDGASLRLEDTPLFRAVNGERVREVRAAVDRHRKPRPQKPAQRHRARCRHVGSSRRPR